MADVMVRESFVDAVNRLLDGRKLPWLAEKSGVPYGRLKRLMNLNSEKQPMPTLGEAQAIAKVFEVPIETLTGGES